MFPINWNDVFRKKDGTLIKMENLGEGGGGGSELPSHSISDAGKVLTVGDDGSLEWDEAGGAGVEIIPIETWEAMTTAEKQSKGIVALTSANSGYYRGIVVNGADYTPFVFIDDGGDLANNPLSYTFESSGTYKVVVLLFNNQASTYELNASLTINGSQMQSSSEFQHYYQASGDNVRNYRICIFDLNNISANDVLNITPSSTSAYTNVLFVVFKSSMILNALAVAKTLADTSLEHTSTTTGIALYGSCVGTSPGDYNITCELISESKTYNVPALSSSFCTTFLFILQ